jgi:hypothetical protein
MINPFPQTPLKFLSVFYNQNPCLRLAVIEIHHKTKPVNTVLSIRIMCLLRRSTRDRQRTLVPSLQMRFQDPSVESDDPVS